MPTSQSSNCVKYFATKYAMKSSKEENPRKQKKNETNN